MSKKDKKRERGRPAYEPTLEDREKVAAAAGGGMSHEEIAIALGIARGTLEKHFAHELSHGAYRKRLEVILAMQKAAANGNVSAAKAYLDGSPFLAPTPLPKAEEVAKAKPKGKKAIAQEEARTAQLGDPEWNALLPGAESPTKH